MHIQINTDSNVEASDELVHRVEAEIGAALSRLRDHITRVEVHLGDESSGRSGDADKRCMVEARPAGQQPVAVTHHAATLDEACGGAAQKLRNLLDSRFGRLDDRKGGASIRTDERR
jgi:hypothetical protein